MDDAAFAEWRSRERARYATLRPTGWSDAEARITDGLIRAIVASNYLARVREAAPSVELQRMLGGEHYRELAVLLERMTYALQYQDREVIGDLRKLARRLEKRDPIGPLGGVFTTARARARSLRDLLDIIKRGEIADAIRSHLAAEGRTDASTFALRGALPSTRWNVALFLSAYLHDFGTGTDDGERASAIYAAMPLGHGNEVDLTGLFREEPFEQDSEATVRAAFRALGYPADDAKRLFHADETRRRRRSHKERT